LIYNKKGEYLMSEANLPEFDEFLAPILKYANNDKEHTLSEIIEAMSNQFNISEKDRNILMPNSKRTYVYDRIALAVEYLVQAGLLVRVEESKYKISDIGKEEAKIIPEKISSKYLEKFESFQKFKRSTQDNDVKSISANDQGKKEESPKNSSVLPPDDSIPDNSGNDIKIKINKYIVIAVIVIIILLVIAYLLYHYDILGVRTFVRHTLGLSTLSSNTNANSVINTLVSSNFPGINRLNLSLNAENAEDLGNSSFESYALFGAGNAAKAMENGSSPQGLNGMLILLGTSKNNESFSYYYQALSNYQKIYNITIDGIPAIEAIENTTPPENSSLSESYGAFNLTGYRCNASGFDAIIKSKLNQTVKITNASIYSLGNMSKLNSTVFDSSVTAIKPNETFNVLFPEEKCNSTEYENEFTIGTNYSITKLGGFVGFVRFSPYLVKTNQSEVINVVAVNNSTLYQIFTLSNGNNYVNELNSGFSNFIKNITIQDFAK